MPADEIKLRLISYFESFIDSPCRIVQTEKMRSRLILFACLAFTLLFAQQGAALHALSHFADGVPVQSQQEKQLPHSPACDKCVFYAGIGSAAPSSPPVFAAQQATVILAAVLFLLFFSAPLYSYLSRAPPRLACLAVVAA